VSDPADILAHKRALRARMRAWRCALDAKAKEAAARAVAELGLAFLPPLPAASVVSAFAPLAGEFPIWPLVRRLGCQFALALPVIEGKSKPLIFRAFDPGEALERGVWGIGEPKPHKRTLDPDILLVPLLAVDRQGWRLGYGGGYFDRTLRGLRARKSLLAVGVAHDQQVVDAVPHLDYDERLDWVLTPSGPIRCMGT
jgi:5-formyltetrahydrofolate cyclo-ligase